MVQDYAVGIACSSVEIALGFCLEAIDSCDVGQLSLLDLCRRSSVIGNDDPLHRCSMAEARLF